MQNFFFVTVIGSFLLALSVAAHADSPKVKIKDGRTIVRDKSKPVRKALEQQYALLAHAVETKDFEAFQRLRTDDFSTVDERGQPQTTEQMAQRAKIMFERIEPPIHTVNHIGTIDVNGNEAVATVVQEFSRMQHVAGQLREVETKVTQDETWINTPDGWKLKYVDNVRDPITFVDGKRIEPDKPYDPEAPPYDPAAGSNKQ